MNNNYNQNIPKYVNYTERKTIVKSNNTNTYHQNNSIILMLDIEGTLNNINDEKAKKFITIIQSLKIKNNAKNAILCLSTHSSDTKDLKTYLDIIHKQLPQNNSITIGKNFYLQGTYDYQKDIKQYMEARYNHYKTQVFEQYYLKESNPNTQNQISNVSWFAIIDDSIDPEYVKKFQHTRLMNIFRPSQYDFNCKSNNNCMCYNTNTKGFDGVLEMLTEYKRDIQNKSMLERLEEQKKHKFPLTLTDLLDLCRQKKYKEVIEHLKITTLTSFEIKSIQFHIKLNIENPNLSQEQVKQLKEIVEILKRQEPEPKKVKTI